MSGINNSFQQAFGASGRIFEILSLETEKDTGSAVISGLSDRIEFEDVSRAVCLANVGIPCGIKGHG